MESTSKPKKTSTTRTTPPKKETPHTTPPHQTQTPTPRPECQGIKLAFADYK